VFELTIRELGGLLSIYELTKDKMFLDRAADLGERLLKAFVSPTGFPDSRVDLKRFVISTPLLSFALFFVSIFCFNLLI
jgi:uncharacterized protein YyaL (SSP411 family)